jgi:thermitase
MHRAASATLGVAMLLVVPSAALGDGTVVVKYADGASSKARSAALERAGVRSTLGQVAVNNARIVRVEGDVAKAVATLNRSKTVDYAAVNGEVKALATPNDARFGELYGIHNTGSTGGTADADIDGPEGWDAAGLGSFPSTGGAKVGIVDTGIDGAHEDLAGKVVECAAVNTSDQVVEGECADGHGHGTHVAGTIAGKANNGVGVAGVAFNADLAICRGLDASGSGTFAGVANCVTWLASKGVDVISMSLGGSTNDPTMAAAATAAWADGTGTLLVAAAGNGGNSTPSYPAAYPEVVSVAATDNTDARAWFSTFNDDVEIAAPGVDVLSAIPGNGYRTMSGTSMATPHVSGVAALIAGSAPDMTPAQVRERLTAAVDDKGAAGRDPEFGFGRVTLSKAFG